MNINFSMYPGRYLMPEPMTDPPWIGAPHSECGLRRGYDPPVLRKTFIMVFLQLSKRRYIKIVWFLSCTF
jgi:hypothetical protein